MSSFSLHGSGPPPSSSAASSSSSSSSSSSQQPSLALDPWALAAAGFDIPFVHRTDANVGPSSLMAAASLFSASLTARGGGVGGEGAAMLSSHLPPSTATAVMQSFMRTMTSSPGDVSSGAALRMRPDQRYPFPFAFGKANVV